MTKNQHSVETHGVSQNGTRVGEGLVAYLEARGVSVVFGIPGVHTVEMYRGLGHSKLRHVAVRHEQGAGFMADGYARASGKLGVAFVITGPGITNILTAMGQALADSIPMLVISSVNETEHLDKGLGHLHEMPNQHGLCSMVSAQSRHVAKGEDLYGALDAALADLRTMRPGPQHIQVPMDVFGEVISQSMPKAEAPTPTTLDSALLSDTRARLAGAERPVIIAGGGSLLAADAVAELAEALNAPVVQTINARGVMYDHALSVPASPSLPAIKALLAEADTVLAIGTELGPTDFDLYSTGDNPAFNSLIRIDIDADQLDRHSRDVALYGPAQEMVPAILNGLGKSNTQAAWGSIKADSVRSAARAQLPPEYEHLVQLVETIRDTFPNSIIVGDSTQPIYAANMYYAHDNVRGWFNSSVGFGTLGYAIPAAIGAALGAPEKQVVCITGDGGAQFTLPELMTAVDEKLPVIFLIWNNFAFGEIASAMRAVDVAVVGCHPTPPNFEGIAAANYMPFVQCDDTSAALRSALKAHPDRKGPMMIEIQVLN